MTADHKAALKLASAIIDAEHQVASEYINLAAAYLELRELAKSHTAKADGFPKPIQDEGSPRWYSKAILDWLEQERDTV